MMKVALLTKVLSPPIITQYGSTVYIGVVQHYSHT